MISSRRILTIYRKELLEIIRDRRTMIAMIVIPVVLYPVLMLWLIWETQSEQDKLSRTVMTIEVADDPARRDLEHIIASVARQQPATSPSDEPRPRFDVRVGRTPDEELGPEAQLRVALNRAAQPVPLPPRLEVLIDYNDVNVRSRSAKEELVFLLNEYRSILTRESIRRLLGHDAAAGTALTQPAVSGVDRDIDLILRPVEITATPTASQRQRGGWALGQIIPILLVLMVVSGAIYPAVDLTAGERERGTLETLMATPVPTLHLIVGKFLVVATIALLTAALNLASVGATMHFGGVSRLMAGAAPIEFPLSVLPIILLCMVPLSLLAAAILVAVCSFARTFKEAQNYVVPVIIGTLVACVPVSMETVRLTGPLLILPVGNMVLLARDMLQQTCTAPATIVVLLSTTLYAAAAIAVAARLFGQEAVLFVDTGSFKNLFRRRLFTPARRPTTAQALLLAALLFPICFYGQLGLSGDSPANLIPMLKQLAIWQFVGLFVVLPVILCVYFRIDVLETFRFRQPPARAWLAAGMFGLSSWAIAQEFVRWQHQLLPPSQVMIEAARQMDEQLNAAPLGLALLLLALIPAVCEETLFRGFVLSGLSSGLKKWSAILGSAAIFATFHFMVDRIPLTFLLGALLAYICWQSGSLLPGILFHIMHNGSMLVLSRASAVRDWLGQAADDGTMPALPLSIRVATAAVFLLAILILSTATRSQDENGGQSSD
ncbi:MAG TPA: ABC transporter permease subunit/CPBP intramembrane protease [Phycisphaerae bacterium]|nr:ABC transporter permease subunit/CPBP intramembrane protease [Phycisphaerae bacterium]